MNKSFHDLLIHSLQDMYDAEKQILRALPKMAEAATSPKLKEGFQMHEKQTQEHVARLEKIAEQLEFKAKGVPCVGMAGIIKEGDEIIKMELDADSKDAGLIVAAQKVEHYEIVAYASMIAHAELMGHTEIAELLKDTLSEEKATNNILDTLAESSINEKAAGSERGARQSGVAFHS